MENPAPRIALISAGMKLGGSTTYLCNLGGELVARNIPAHVFSMEMDHPLAADFQSQKIPVSIIDNGRRIYEDRILACVEAVKAFGPTLVVGCLGSSSFEVLRYMPAGIAKVGMVQSDDAGVYSTLAAYREYLDAVVGVSKTIVENLKKYEEFAEKECLYLPYGVPMPPSLPPVDTFPTPLRILYLGRLDEEQKRVRLFPRIYRELCESGIPFCWTIAGDGSERAYLEATMKGGRQDQSVVFCGKVSYQDVPALLEDQDVFLLTSIYEGLPLSLLEAMGRGIVPVVSALESGIPEVVNPANGMLVQVEDLGGYARALTKMHSQREMLAAMRLKAREAVYPTFTISSMADRWIDLAAALAKTPIGDWPTKPKILQPFGCNQGAFYSTPGRWARRLARALSR